jgi:hypothetical protein
MHLQKGMRSRLPGHYDDTCNYCTNNFVCHIAKNLP